MLAVLVVLGACNTEPNVPTAVTLSSSSLSFTALNQSQQLSASVFDQHGHRLNGEAVSWASNNSAVATVSSAGLVTAHAIGAADITAAAGAVSAKAHVVVVQTPTQLQKVSGDGQSGPAGQPLPTPLVVQVNDALGNPVSDLTVTFAVSQGGGTVSSSSARTGADGRAATVFTVGSQAGSSHQVSASVADPALSASFTATATAGTPAAIVMHEGENQQVLVGSVVPIRPAVSVRDALGNRVPGVTVVFEVVSGGGTITGGSTVTDANGIARVGSWTVGTEPGTNTLNAATDLPDISGNPITFTATAKTSFFNIKFQYLRLDSSSQQQAFEEARARWETLIIGDLEGVVLNADFGTCGPGSPAVNEIVDDVLIQVSLDTIDGPGGVLASAGPCFIRTSNNLPVMGAMSFDTEDFAALEADGLIQGVVLHEMGHVLGFGSIWSLDGLLASPSLSGGTDPHFTGAQATGAFNNIGGTTYAGSKVPVEDTGGEGTADSHWRESVFGNELMTGFIDPVQNPLSAVTVESLADLGYLVNASLADPYGLMLSLRASPSQARLQLRNDILQTSIKRVDRHGRIIGIIHPEGSKGRKN